MLPEPRNTAHAQPSVTAESSNLDMLRATAVMFVFAAHWVLQLINVHWIHVADFEAWKVGLNELGHVGVLFFFVHTALVLMLSLERTTARNLVLNFYIRRIFRIYPLSIACILSVLVFQIPQVPEGIYVPWEWHEIVSNLLLVQNIYKLPDMIMPLWTLPREFQMYLALPFIYLATRRFPSSLLALILWFVFVAAVPSAPLLSCFPCFIGGVLAYQLTKEKVFRLPAWVWPVAILVLFLTHALVMDLFKDARADYLLCMFLGGVIPNVIDLPESWWTRISRTVAKYSYGIYLCHDPILWFAFVKLGSRPAAVQWTALVSLMILVPYMAHRFLEAPMIDAGRRLAVHWTVAPRPNAVLAEANIIS